MHTAEYIALAPGRRSYDEHSVLGELTAQFTAILLPHVAQDFMPRGLDIHKWHLCLLLGPTHERSPALEVQPPRKEFSGTITLEWDHPSRAKAISRC